MKRFMISALILGAASFLSAQNFNSMRTEYYKYNRTKPEEALKIAKEMENLPDLTEREKSIVLGLQLGAAYNMKNPETCVELAKKIIDMPDAPAATKASAYYLGGIKQGQMKNNEEFLRYMIEGEKIAPTDEMKFNLMVFHIEALIRLKRNAEAIDFAEQVTAFAKEKKQRNWELHVCYVVSGAYPRSEQCELFENLMKEPDVFAYPYGQHIARRLLNDHYSKEPEKAKALCERVLKEAKKMIHPDFKRKLDQLSK